MWRSVLALMLALCLPVLCLTLPALADDKPLDTEAVNKLVAQLGDMDATMRDEAAKQLSKGGKEVIEPVAAAADSTNLEQVSRCVGVLAELRSRDDAELKAAATAALQKLTTGRNLSAARRARAILKPPPVIVAQNNAMRTRLSVRRTPNQTDITAEENDKKYEITEKASGEITMKVTEPDANGKPQTKEYSGKNADDLKKNAPEAHAHYEKYAKSVNRAPNLNINIGAVPAAGPIQIQAQIGNLVDGRRAGAELQKHRETVQKSIEKLRALTEKKDLKPEELKPILEELEAANQSLDQAAKKLNP